MKNLLKLVMAALMVISFSAFADSVSLNYSAIQKNGSGTVGKGTWEMTGVKAIRATTDLTVKGSLSNVHATPGYGTGLEVGFREKFPLSESATVWVQPALTFHSPESGGSYGGYVVDAGVDLKQSKFTFTPAVSYANDFGDSRETRQTTVGVKVAYAVNKNWSVDSRYRHEYNEVGQDANRLYAGLSYKF